MERMTELQQSKYQDLQAGLPSELSMQLAEVALALGSAEDQVTSPGHSFKQMTAGFVVAHAGIRLYKFRPNFTRFLSGPTHFQTRV